MTTFADLITQVNELTVRPDLTADTIAAIKTATLWAHSSDFYPKDIFEVPLTFSSPATLQEFEYRTSIPRWRALKYFRLFDFTTDTPGNFFDVLDPTDTVDSYGIHRTNVCYLAGELLKFRGAEDISGGLLGCYIHPDIAQATYESWIANENMFVVAYKAASTVLRTIGFQDRAKALDAEAREQLLLLSRSNILAIGE